MIQQLPKSNGEIPAGPQYDSQKEALKQTLVKYLCGQWRLKEERYFFVKAEIGWNPMEKFVENALRDQGHSPRPLNFEWHSPGYDLIRVFETGRIFHQYIAVAMLKESIEGQQLVAYFSLEKAK